MRFAPSILAADFSNLTAEIRRIEAAGADLIHLDVMDGHFVPPISFGAQLVSSLRPHSKLVFDVHLMVERPSGKIDDFVAAGANWITFHIEAELHAHRLLTAIKSAGCQVGVSLVPSTPVAALSELLPLLDLVLVMTVNPGYGGQKLLPFCLDKIRQLHQLRQQHRFPYAISVDGGVDLSTAVSLQQAGADILISGSSFFTAADPASYCRKIQQLPTLRDSSSPPG